MRKVLLSAAIVASLVLPPMQAANACTRYPCHTACHLRGGDVSVDPESGTATLEPFSFECYY